MEDMTASIWEDIDLQSFSVLTRLPNIYSLVDILAKRKEPYLIEKLLNLVRSISQVLPIPIEYCKLTLTSTSKLKRLQRNNQASARKLISTIRPSVFSCFSQSFAADPDSKIQTPHLREKASTYEYSKIATYSIKRLLRHSTENALTLWVTN